MVVLSIFFSLLACGEAAGRPELCADAHAETIRLSGTVGIDSSGAYVFKGTNHSAEGRGSGTYLHPCSSELADYLNSAYDASLHLRRAPPAEEAFWVTIEGSYLTDHLLDPSQASHFAVRWVALGPE